MQFHACWGTWFFKVRSQVDPASTTTKETKNRRNRKRRQRQQCSKSKQKRQERKQLAEETELNANTIINLSKISLNKAELQLLSLGLTFCPESSFNYSRTRVDIFQIIRKLKLIKYFKLKHGNNTTTSPNTEPVPVDANLMVSDIPTILTMHDLQSTSDSLSTQQILSEEGITGSTNIKNPFKPQSTFTPMMPRDSIDTFNDVTIEELKDLHHRTVKRQRSSKQRNRQYFSLIKRLQNNNQVIINKSDKGGNIVLWPRKQYLEEAHRHLNDHTCNKKSNAKEIVKIRKERRSKLNNFEQEGLLTRGVSLS